MKTDKYGTPMYITSIGGKELDIGRSLEKGHDNNAYLHVMTLSDTVEINGEEHYFKNLYGNIILEIKDIATSTDEQFFSETQINLFPNPISPNRVLNYEIKNDQNLSVEKIDLFSMYGQQIKSYNITGNKGRVELPELSVGIYFLHFKNREGKIMGVDKIVVL